jgi:hypothetical protein
MNLFATGRQPADRPDLRPLVTFTRAALLIGWSIVALGLHATFDGSSEPIEAESGPGTVHR